MVTNTKATRRETPTDSIRTTFSIDSDAYLIVRQRAELTGETFGQAASELIRQSVKQSDSEPEYFNGIRLLPTRGTRKLVTVELVNELMNELP
jgi:hypothetical protein